MADPSADLNFAVVLWWLPVPVLVAIIVLTEERLASARKP